MLLVSGSEPVNMVAKTLRQFAGQEAVEQESVLSLIKAVLDIKGVSTLNVNLRALVHLLKKVLKPETWQNLLQVNQCLLRRGCGTRGSNSTYLRESEGAT